MTQNNDIAAPSTPAEQVRLEFSRWFGNGGLSARPKVRPPRAIAVTAPTAAVPIPIVAVTAAPTAAVPVLTAAVTTPNDAVPIPIVAVTATPNDAVPIPIVAVTAAASAAVTAAPPGVSARRVEWARVLPFLAMHAICLAVIWVGFSWVAFGVTVASYLMRMFAITGFYHRYFSHRTFKTSRAAQFVFGLLGASAVQRGPIWWAAHHRHHHRHSDKPADVHSPGQHGFFWSHMGWFMSHEHFSADLSRVKDLLKYPELRFLDRYDIAVPTALGAGVFLLGVLLKHLAPGLGTSGVQMLVWGFFISTVAVYHGTYTINSLSHVFGRQRYKTGDDSRNNVWLAIITLGEGWHNNHHHYPASARQGFYWWEFDITFYLLKILSCCGLIWDLRPVPAAIREGAGKRC